jgi:capsular exopolysaccharide synthesis family protein
MIPFNGARMFPEENDPAGQPSLRRYLATLKQRWLFILLAILLCTGAAAAYVFTASEVYEAHADMLVTPVPDDQTAVLGLGLIRRASDPTRDVTTAARLISNVEVARLAARTLGSSESPEALLNRISVEPVAQSSFVAITASAGTPREARLLANAFGKAAVTERTVQLHLELDSAIKNMRSRIAQVAGSDAGDAEPLYEQLAALESLRSGPDPTLRLETPASDPTSPVSPRVRLSLAGGLFAGLLLGVAGAFALSALDTRGEREDRLEQMGLTILAHVPDMSRSRYSFYAFEEAFRFLRTALRFASSDHPYGTIAVTSASEREGKTTASAQLAFAALEAGQTVILVEVDAYRPALRRIIEASNADNDLDGPGLLDYLSDEATLGEIIKPTAMPGLSFVSAGSLRTQSITGLLEQHQVTFIHELAALADLVILDCPPVGARSDGILIAAIADAVLLVVDAKRSSDRDLRDAVRRLRSARAEIVGVVLNRDDSASAEYNYEQTADNGTKRGYMPTPSAPAPGAEASESRLSPRRSPSAPPR